MAKAELDAMAALSALVLEDGRRWGQAALPWQVADARAILEGPERYLFLTRPRGGSKTSDLGAVATAALVAQLADRSRSYALAADRDQGGLLVDAMHGFVERSGLAALLKLDAFKVTNVQTGATLEVLAADEASSWGLRPHLVIVDEFAQWKATAGPRRLWSALFSALPKVPGSRLVILTSAGDPSHWSFKVLEHARAEEAWRTSEIPGPCPWISPEDLAIQRAMLPAWEYARLHENVWTESDGRLTTVDDVRACVGHSGTLPAEPGVRYVMGLDLGLTNDRTVLTLGHLEQFDEGAVVVVDRMHVWEGSKANPVELSDVEAVIVECWMAYGRPPLVYDPWQAASIAQRLRRRGVRCEQYPFHPGSISRLAATMYQLLSQRMLDLPDDEALIDELGQAQLIERSPGSWRIDHPAGGHDDRVLSLALCAHRLLSAPQRGRMRFHADPEEMDP